MCKTTSAEDGVGIKSSSEGTFSDVFKRSERTCQDMVAALLRNKY